MPQLNLVAERQEDHPISIEFMHRDLMRSGLTPEDLGAYPVAPIAFEKCGAYIIPYRDPLMWRIRYDRKEDKYKQPKGLRGVWWSPRQSLQEARNQPVIYIIEGEKKAAAFVKKWPHLFAFGIGGAHNALEPKADGTKVLLDDILQVLSPGKTVHAIFDGDILNKLGIQEAATNLAYACSQLKVDVKVWYPPEGKGVDDWLVANPNAALSELTEITEDKLQISRKTLYRRLGLTLNEDGFPHQNDTNIAALLANRWEGTIISDRRLGVYQDGEQADLAMIHRESKSYIQKKFMHGASSHMIASALEDALLDLRRDLIKELVESLEWDQVSRLSTWGSQYIKSNNPKVANEWGRLLMTGLALRIMQPGTKVDIVPILVGKQGIGKTTFFEELSSFNGYKFYQSLLNFSSDANDGNRTEVTMLEKAVIVDLGEGVVFNSFKQNQDIVKQRISQTYDSYRPAYSKVIKTVQRGFIFVGTSNRRDLLSDSTGSRRFLMLEALSITKLPYAEKLQILAEVVAKQDQILQSNWYDIQLTLEDFKQAEITQEEDRFEHITNVQERINAGFRKDDTFETSLLELINDNRCATAIKNGDVFVTVKFLKAMLDDAAYANNADKILNRLRRLEASITFPYIIEPWKPRDTMLIFPGNSKQLYMGSITNSQGMLSGYRLSLKK